MFTLRKWLLTEAKPSPRSIIIFEGWTFLLLPSQECTTGHSRYVDFTYLDTTTYIEVMFIPNIFYLYFFAFQLRLCRKQLTWSNGYLEVIFHALDIFSIIFATVYVEVKIGARMGAIVSALAMYVY